MAQEKAKHKMTQNITLKRNLKYKILTRNV